MKHYTAQNGPHPFINDEVEVSHMGHEDEDNDDDDDKLGKQL